MELGTFEIDLINERIQFYFSNSEIKNPHIETVTVSFDKVVSDLAGYSEDYLSELKEITDKLDVEIANGNHVNDPLSAKLYQIMFTSDNIIACVLASVVEYFHLDIKKRMKNSIIIKMWEREIQSFHSHLFNDIKEFKTLVDTDFGRKKESAFNLSVRLEKNRTSKVLLTDSFRDFVGIFSYVLYLKDLHVFTCKHCGSKYLAVADLLYCKQPACQKELEKEKRRTKRQTRKYDPFVRPLDNFHEYARGRKREMTLAGATEEELAAFEELHKKHADYIRGSLDAFKNKGELPDDEFYQICKSFKKELKARMDYVINQNRNKA